MALTRIFCLLTAGFMFSPPSLATTDLVTPSPERLFEKGRIIDAETSVFEAGRREFLGQMSEVIRNYHLFEGHDPSWTAIELSLCRQLVGRAKEARAYASLTRFAPPEDPDWIDSTAYDPDVDINDWAAMRSSIRGLLRNFKSGPDSPALRERIYKLIRQVESYRRVYGYPALPFDKDGSVSYEEWLLTHQEDPIGPLRLPYVLMGKMYIEYQNMRNARRSYLEQMRSSSSERAAALKLEIDRLDSVLSDFGRSLAAFRIPRLILEKAAFQTDSEAMIIRHYERLANEMPDRPWVQHYLGALYSRHFRFEDALAQYHKALSLNPHFAEAHGAVGIVYGSIGRLDLSRDAFVRAVEFKPDYDQAHYGLGLVYVALGKSEQARKEYRTLKKLRSPYAENLRRALPDRGRGRVELRSKVIDPAMGINPDVWEPVETEP